MVLHRRTKGLQEFVCLACKTDKKEKLSRNPSRKTIKDSTWRHLSFSDQVAKSDCGRPPSPSLAVHINGSSLLLILVNEAKCLGELLFRRRKIV
jgi:hypothetical protein